jgi:outer membrane receptor for ferrienterochelin and colicins
VVIAGSDAGTATDSLGIFTLYVSPDQVKVEVRSVGFKAHISELQPPLQKPLQITLEPSTLGLDEVVVTGTLSPVFVSQSPIKTEVLTTKHFNTFMPSASNNLVDAMQLVNGVQEIVSCGVCFTNNISINGLPGQYSAILVDGTPMYGNLASVYGLNSIPGIMVDRIEVIKGPGSTLYGSEAVAGVINIITRQPDKEPAVNLDIMGTSHGESFLNLAGSSRFGKTSMYSGVNYSGMQQFIDENNDNFGDIINMDRLSLFSKWVTDLPDNRKFTIVGKYMHENRRNGTREFMESHENLVGNDSIYGESIVTQRAEIFGSYEGPFDLKIDYSFSLHEQDSYYGSDHYQASQHIGFANIYRNMQLGRHGLLVGSTFRYQYYDDNTVATPDGADRQFIPGLFIQDDWNISEKFTVLSGLRGDYYNDHGFIFSPRLSTRWKAGKWTTVRLNSGTGFRIVNLFT